MSDTGPAQAIALIDMSHSRSVSGLRLMLLAVWAIQVFAASVFLGSQASASGLIVEANEQTTSFVDASRHRVYLAGAHTWNNLIDMDAAWPARQFDFEAYLVFLEDHHFNLTRLWTWELPAAASDRYPRRQVAGPLPWARTGPGMALDQRARFDLTKFDAEYFNRLRERVQLAQERRVYVIVMLFEGWGVQFAPGKFSHPFGRDNNINGIDFGADPRSIRRRA